MTSTKYSTTNATNVSLSLFVAMQSMFNICKMSKCEAPMCEHNKSFSEKSFSVLIFRLFFNKKTLLKYFFDQKVLRD